MTLSERDVHVWLWPTEQAPSDLESRHAHWLNDEERARCARLKIDRVRFEYVMTRVLCRHALSAIEPNVDPAAWTFVRNEHGKPEVSGPIEQRDHNALRFNLSNTFGLVACAITRGRDLGIDVEDRARNSDALKIADRYFSESEVNALRALPEAAQERRFFEYWTLKEAYIKARGMGLAIPLGHFSFQLDGRSEIGIAFDPKLDDDATTWSFMLHSVSEQHQMALALREPGAMRVVFERSLP